MNAVTLANESSRFKKVLLATLVTSALTACGGGGGGGAAPPPPPPPPVNRSPTANAGTDFNVDENSNSALAGSGTDSDGTISTYLWVQTAGPTVSLSSTSAAAPTFVTPDVDSDTTLSFTLTVTDDDGLEASDSVDVTIINIPDPNVAPTANAGPDFEINEEQNTALDGSGTDTDGTISAYLWAQTAGPTVTLSSTTVAAPTFVSPQVDLDTLLSFTLTVTDDGGLTATDSVDVNVLDVVDVNAPPIAKAGTD